MKTPLALILSFMKQLLLKNKKGQVAIFIVLVFQVLFILFAMSLNIALVVHDKINMQNSLDLAAYYGAKKQSEVLNAMAHINYQMRQNWKLLAWRYRILGTLAQHQGYQNSSKKDYWCPQDKDRSTNCSSVSSRNQNLCSSAPGIYPNYCDEQYFTCISHAVWSRGINSAGGQNLCTQSGVTIEPVTKLDLVGGFLPEAQIAAQTVVNLQNEMEESCPTEGALNWLMTQLFMTHFRLDQKDRKVMLQEIYNKTLKEGKDLDGMSIFEGAKKVFELNLTTANLKNIKSLPDKGLEEFNSFKDKEFKEVFDRLNVFPILQFIYDNSTDKGNCDQGLGRHFQSVISHVNFFDILQNKSNNHPLSSFLTDEQKKLFNFNSVFSLNSDDPMQELTLSFFKKSDQILYYGLKADFTYNSNHQIFSLSLEDGLHFKASAFAKAFGGNFGPQPIQSDPFIPTQHSDTPQKIPSADPSTAHLVLQPNYSRWVGDQWGLVDAKLHDSNSKYSFLNKHSSYDDTKRVYIVTDYLNLISGPESTADDPLARSNNTTKASHSFTRMMELMAVYPDLYDISYYSIQANYHQTYFKKICKLLLNGSDCNPNKRNEFTSSAAKNRKIYIRGDFGWPDTSTYITENKTKKSIELSIAPYFLIKDSNPIDMDNITIPTLDPKLTSPAVLKGPHTKFKIIKKSPPLTRGNLSYPWHAKPLPDKLMSSWTNPHPLNYDQYELDDKRFLECDKALVGMPVASACSAKGRSGYSVKLISCETVKNFSLKPDNITEYCPN